MRTCHLAGEVPYGRESGGLDRPQYFRDYEKSKRSRQFLKEWKQNRPWLVDTETGMVHGLFILQRTKRLTNM
jgi:hypothetical protein